MTGSADEGVAIEVLEAASKGATMLVVGSHGRGDLSALVMGSTSHGLIRGAGVSRGLRPRLTELSAESGPDRPSRALVSPACQRHRRTLRASSRGSSDTPRSGLGRNPPSVPPWRVATHWW